MQHIVFLLQSTKFVRTQELKSLAEFAEESGLKVRSHCSQEFVHPHCGL